MKAVAHFVVHPQPDRGSGGEIEFFHLISQGQAEGGFGLGVFLRVARAGRFEPPCALSQVFIDGRFLHVAEVELGSEPVPGIAGGAPLAIRELADHGFFHLGGQATLRSVAFAFSEKAVDSAGPEPVDPGLDGGLAASKIISDLLGAGAFHGQFDGEHAFALPTGSFIFESDEKLGADS